MSELEAIRDNIVAKPSTINRNDTSRDRRRKIDQQYAYNSNVSSILRGLIGQEGNDGRRRMNEEFIVELMTLTDAQYRQRVSSFMKVFNGLLRYVDRVKNITSQLGTEDIIFKEVDNNKFYLTRGWDSALIKAINFFLAHSIKLLTVNRKRTRPPTIRNQYRFTISDVGRDILLNMARFIDNTEEGGSMGPVEESVNNFIGGRVTRTLVTSLIRAMISKLGSEHLGELVPDNLLREVRNVYLIKNLKGGKKSTVIAEGARKKKDDLVMKNLSLARDLVDGDGNRISYNTVANNSLLQEVMSMTIPAIVEIVEIGEGKDKVVVSIGDRYPETTIENLITERSSLEAELLKRSISTQKEIIVENADRDNATKIRQTAKSNINRLHNDVASKTKDMDKKGTLAIASGITSIVGEMDNTEGRILSARDIRNNANNMSEVNQQIGKDDDDILIHRFLDDVVKKNATESKKDRSGPKEAKKRRQARQARRR